jgi:hypothetical protein
LYKWRKSPTNILHLKGAYKKLEIAGGMLAGSSILYEQGISLHEVNQTHEVAQRTFSSMKTDKQSAAGVRRTHYFATDPTF